MAPHGKELSLDIRKKIVKLHGKGHSYTRISKSLLVSRNTVAKVVQRSRQRHDVANVRRPGRPCKLTLRDERRLLRIAEANRKASTLELVEIVKSQFGKSVSCDTIRRLLHRASLRGRRPRRKPLLKPKHKTDRLKFANEYFDKENRFWDSVLWSDETKINLFGSDGVQWVWRRSGEEHLDKCMVPTVKHGGGNVLLWGCMSSSGVGELHFIDGLMDAKMYIQILQEKMLPCLRAIGRRATFQHDNDPKHSARATTAFLLQKNVSVLQWPSMSPDLNPIEHLWGILKRKVEEHNPKNIEALKNVIQQEWNAIDPSICQKLVHSMKRRLTEVIRNKGGHTKY